MHKRQPTAKTAPALGCGSGGQVLQQPLCDAARLNMLVRVLHRQPVSRGRTTAHQISHELIHPSVKTGV